MFALLNQRLVKNKIFIGAVGQSERREQSFGGHEKLRQIPIL